MLFRYVSTTLVHRLLPAAFLTLFGNMLIPPVQAFDAELLSANPHVGTAITRSKAELRLGRAASEAVPVAAALWQTGDALIHFSVVMEASLREEGTVSSATCLTCHDGVLTFGSAGHGVVTRGFQVIGGRLQSNHPVGVAYDPFVTDLRPESASIPGSPAHVGDLLVQGRVECISCHAMSAERAIPGTALIREEFAAADHHCLVCHDM